MTKRDSRISHAHVGEEKDVYTQERDVQELVCCLCMHQLIDVIGNLSAMNQERMARTTMLR
jgi:hypothetical protein